MAQRRGGVTRVVRGIVVGVLLLAAADVSAAAASQLRVTICHATSSVTNPYNLITVDVSAVDGSRNNNHSSHPRDIIPPINGLPGQNWDARGQAVFAAGCRTSVLADTDDDGKRDVVDPDDDGDGIPDGIDPDDDGDGISDDQDPDQALKTDTDGDGIPDARDGDDDADGVRDRFDSDDDGDGLPDVVDPDRPGSTDVDNDCIPDRDDVDNNNDGIFEADPAEEDVQGLRLELTTASARALACVPADTDGDGRVDSADPDDNGDGRPDQFTADADRDGKPDYLDRDDDGDGTPDARDNDDDGDGIAETVAQVLVEAAPELVEADDGVAVLLRDSAVLTDAGQPAAVTIACRVTSGLRSAVLHKAAILFAAGSAAPMQTPMDAEGPDSNLKGACRVERRANSWVALVTPGAQAVATIRLRAPAVGDRLPVDVVQRVRISG